MERWCPRGAFSACNRRPPGCPPPNCRSALLPARRSRDARCRCSPRDRFPAPMRAASPFPAPAPSACTSPPPDAHCSRPPADTQRNARRESAIRYQRSASAIYEFVVHRAAHRNCSLSSSNPSTAPPPAGTFRSRSPPRRPVAPPVRHPAPVARPTARRPPHSPPPGPTAAPSARSTRGVYVHAACSHAELAPRPPILACVESAPCVCMCPGPPAAALVSGVPSASAIHRADVARARNDTPARIFFRRCSHIAAAPCAKPES